MPTPKVAFIVEATEYERGWGQRPDGYVVLQSEADADAFIRKETAGRSGRAPDIYVAYRKIGYKEAGEVTLQKLEDSPRGYFWVQHQGDIKQ